MTKRLKRIAPLQLGKMSAVIYALGSLIVVPFILLFTALASVIQPAPIAVPGIAALGLGAIIIFPIIYGILGFIVGAFGALIYNLVAKWIGGIEVEV